jgi:glucose/arabinose dehydrogenase
MKRVLRFAALAATLATVAGVGGSCAAQDRAMAAPTKKLAGRLTLPSGFDIDYFAERVPGVRTIVLGPDGAVYAAIPEDGRILRLWDVDGDGHADSTRVAVTGLDRPTGMAFHDGWLYIANTGGVVRVKLDASGRATGKPQPIASYSGGGGHWTRTIVFGPDGGMYVSIGSTCNVCEERSPQRAAVMRFDADGKNGRVFARGLRNAVGMAVNPQTHEIWVSQNERDNIAPDHEDLPPEEINILRDGGDYGWPYCYTQRGKAVPNPEFHDPARCATTIPAALEMQAHSAPLGMTFLDQATQFPADWRGDLLLAFHGSWNRRTPTGAKVVRVRVQDGKPVGVEDFITGWQTSDGSRWGRPSDVIVYKDGSVLVADDRSDAIYRVTH